MLVDAGASLSHGQKQLLCLGRALLKRAPVMLVDEATSAIDAHTESLLYAALKAHLDSTGATLLMICHKLQNVPKLCDKVCDGIVSAFPPVCTPYNPQ